MPDNSTIFRELRYALGLTTQEAAIVFDVSDRSVRYWEKGQCPDSVLEEMKYLVKALELRVSEMLDIISEQKPDKIDLKFYAKAEKTFPYFALPKLKNYVVRRVFVETQLSGRDWPAAL